MFFSPSMRLSLIRLSCFIIHLLLHYFSTSILSEFSILLDVMIKILNPHHSSTTLKTAEILSKYRPIAPKPGTLRGNDDDPSSSMSQKINQSPYLRNLWPQLQARPTRTRKRGRGGMGPTSSLALKRPKPATTTVTTQRVLGPIKTLSFQAFTHHGLPNLAQVGYALENVGSPALVTLPLLQCSPPLPPPAKCMEPEVKGKCVIDLNKTAEVIQERDFLTQLQGPITTTTTTRSRVISPQPIRPVCSRINVAYVNPLTNPSPPSQTSKKSPREVEEEVDSDNLPSVITDSNNRVRLVNSAYKEMMGQPECSWLDSMVRGKRICGEVMINFCDSKIPMMTENNGFSCWVRIDWERDGKEEYMHAFCDVKKLACDYKDYVFAWRFHATTDYRETCQSSCHA